MLLYAKGESGLNVSRSIKEKGVFYLFPHSWLFLENKLVWQVRKRNLTKNRNNVLNGWKNASPSLCRATNTGGLYGMLGTRINGAFLYRQNNMLGTRHYSSGVNLPLKTEEISNPKPTPFDKRKIWSYWVLLVSQNTSSSNNMGNVKNRPENEISGGFHHSLLRNSRILTGNSVGSSIRLENGFWSMSLLSLDVNRKFIRGVAKLSL